MIHYINFYMLYPCAIPDEDTVLLTGGYLGRRTVSRYNIDGWMKDSFPILNEGRHMHGCAAFVMDLEPVRGRIFRCKFIDLTTTFMHRFFLWLEDKVLL